jgi:hypothetical protein
MNPMPMPPIEHEALARRLAAGLDAPLSRDIAERLRAARVRAVAARRISTHQVQSNGTLTMGQAHEQMRPWGWLASVVPLIALVVGLVTIKHFQDEHRAREVAEVDTAMLIGDLPPSAYADPGFLRFLSMPLPEQGGASGPKPE